MLAKAVILLGAHEKSMGITWGWKANDTPMGAVH